MKSYIDHIDDLFEFGYNKLDDFFNDIIDQFNKQKEEDDFWVFCNKFFSEKFVRAFSGIRDKALSLKKGKAVKRYLNLRNKQISLLISSLKVQFRYYYEEQHNDQNDIENKISTIVNVLIESLNRIRFKLSHSFSEYFEINISYTTPKELFKKKYEKMFDWIESEISRLEENTIQKIFDQNIDLSNIHDIPDEEIQKFLYKAEDGLGNSLLDNEFYEYYVHELDKRIKYLKFIGSTFNELDFIKEIFESNKTEFKKYKENLISHFSLNEEANIKEYFIEIPQSGIIRNIEKIINQRLKIISPNETIESILENQKKSIEHQYKWNKKTIDLLELINALYLEKAISINGAYMEQKDYIELFEILFDTEYNDPYKTMADARNREKPNKFLQQLNDVYLKDVKLKDK